MLISRYHYTSLLHTLNLHYSHSVDSNGQSVFLSNRLLSAFNLNTNTTQKHGLHVNWSSWTDSLRLVVSRLIILLPVYLVSSSNQLLVCLTSISRFSDQPVSLCFLSHSLSLLCFFATLQHHT